MFGNSGNQVYSQKMLEFHDMIKKTFLIFKILLQNIV